VASSSRPAGPLVEIRRAVEDAAGSLLPDQDSPGQLTLERPPQPELGDYSSNAAMLLAAPLGRPPREIAEDLRAELAGRLGENVDRVEIAGPGFVNLYLSDRWYRRALAAIVAGGGEVGIDSVEDPERILVEFVSANPTGPLTAAGGRHAAYGDSLARLLEAVGHAVKREYYANDMGGQADRFVASIAARMSGSEPPEDSYRGPHIEELAERLAAESLDPSDLAGVGRRGSELMLERIRESLQRYRVEFDAWIRESSLYERGDVEAAIAALRERGHVYESEGAVWLRTTEFGDDKDRVLLRSGGEPTYFAADVAYHRDKLERGFDHMIDVLGADHHGYVARMRAAIAALGADPDRYEALIMQLVHLVEGGKRAQMSKRRGEFVTLDELVEDIGVDATRFFMLQRSHDTTVDLDLELARRQSNENPVYYVQYAHARIASILRKAGKGAKERAAVAESIAASMEPAERALLKCLLEMPDEVAEAAQRRAPHRLCAYAGAVAADFHAFYRDCQVVGAEGEGVEQSRLALCVVTKRAIARTLGLLGIEAPERM
jgi:arginyl-tRNA synthetase